MINTQEPSGKSGQAPGALTWHDSGPTNYIARSLLETGGFARDT